jgi:hypothetical protein
VQRNRYSQEIAGVAPPGASPLPKAELVRKKGFVLSRISFRTIVMKKWKQSFWVQYGPHTMLWFCSRALMLVEQSVPQQAERNFLIKLASTLSTTIQAKCSFKTVSYQRIRQKVRQFKLELDGLDRRLRQL